VSVDERKEGRKVSLRRELSDATEWSRLLVVEFEEGLCDRSDDENEPVEALVSVGAEESRREGERRSARTSKLNRSLDLSFLLEHEQEGRGLTKPRTIRKIPSQQPR